MGSTQVPRTALLLSRPLGGTNQASIGSSTNFGTPRGQARSDRSWRCLTRLNQSSFHTEWFEASAGRAKFLGISSLVGLVGHVAYKVQGVLDRLFVCGRKVGLPYRAENIARMPQSCQEATLAGKNPRKIASRPASTVALCLSEPGCRLIGQCRSGSSSEDQAKRKGQASNPASNQTRSAPIASLNRALAPAAMNDVRKAGTK